MKTVFRITATILFILSFSNLYSQNSFHIENTSPVLQYVVPVQEISQGESFEFKIAENTFVDRDQGDKIVMYKASLYNGEELPSWIEFNENELVFSGFAENIPSGEYFIALEAYDKFLAKSVTEIYLRVE